MWYKSYAGVLELVDEADSKSVASDGVWVRVPPPAPKQYNPNQIFPVGDGFGLFVYFGKFEDTHFRNGVIKRPTSKPRGPRKNQIEIGVYSHESNMKKQSAKSLPNFPMQSQQDEYHCIL